MENNDPIFEKYLNNDCSEAEKRAFEKRLATDPGVRGEFGIYQKSLAAIRFAGRADLKKRLRERTFSPPPQAFFLKKIAILCCLLVATGFFFWWKSRPGGAQKPVENELPAPQKPAVKGKAEPEIAEKPVQSPEKPDVSPASKPNKDALFAANFRPFKNDEIMGMARAENDPDAFQKMLDAYLKNDHAGAVVQFEALSGEDRINENILFLKANSLLAIGKTDAATDILEGICNQKTSRFLTAAQWYLALAYLKTGNQKRAEQTLVFIKTSANGGHPFAQNAADLLKNYSTKTKPAQ